MRACPGNALLLRRRLYATVTRDVSATLQAQVTPQVTVTRSRCFGDARAPQQRPLRHGDAQRPGNARAPQQGTFDIARMEPC